MAKFKNVLEVTEDVGVIVGATDSDVVDVSGVSVLSCHIVADVMATAKTCDSGEVEIDTFTFDTKANTDPGDYIVVYDTDGLAWAAAADVSGTDEEPTGDIWAAIPAGRKVHVDISGATDAASVAALFETAMNALADVPFTASDAGGGGALAVTMTARGVCTAPVVSNEDDSGVGSVAVVVTNAGVDPEIDLDANTLSIPTHGFKTGAEVQVSATGTLPTGLSAVTDYYVIRVDASTIKLATTHALALLGTAINITGYGSDGNVTTVTPVSISGASVGLYKSNDGVNWLLDATATNITADASIILEKIDPACRFYKLTFAVSAGSVDITLNWLGKGIDG